MELVTVKMSVMDSDSDINWQAPRIPGMKLVDVLTVLYQLQRVFSAESIQTFYHSVNFPRVTQRWH